MALKYILLLLLLVIFSNSWAQKPKVPQRNSTAAHTLLERRLDSIFASFTSKSPGVAIIVLQNGKVVAKRAYGMASLEFDVPFTHQTLVRIPYSEGRIFISTATALLEKEGKLQLQDKVRKYFPLLPAWSEAVTIQDLLNHSSGFADEWATLALTQASMANKFDKSQFLKFLYNQPAPSVEPGRGYMYSNSDFGLLRLILEKASGENLSGYMKRRIFEPLQMKDSRLHDDQEAVIANHAFTYNVHEGGTYKLWLQDKTSPGGNYYVLTSANDLQKWAAAHADPVSFVSTALHRLKQNARPIPVLPQTNYVFGLKQRKISGHDVFVQMGVSELPFVAHIPEKKITVIMLSNLFMQRWKQMEQVIYAALNKQVSKPKKIALQQQSIKVTQAEIAPLAGIYKWMVPLTFQSYVPRKRFTEFVAENGQLKVVYSREDTFGLVPVAPNTFRDPDYPDLFVFSRTKQDATPTLIMYTFDGDTIRMEKSSTAKRMVDKSELQKLTGKYYSKHLDFYWTLALNENNQLVVKRPTIADKIIEPSVDGEYILMMDYGAYSGDGWIKFYFKENNEVSHFTVTHPRLMQHRFDKVAASD